jgi:hypothetical protein
MTEGAPAARFHEAVLRVLQEQGRSKNWLHNKTGVARSTVDAWAIQPRPPQARTVLAVAEALGMDRTDALRLAGVLADLTVDINDEAVALTELDTDVLLAELRRRISG